MQKLRHLKLASSSVTFLFSSINIFPQSVCTFINIHKLWLYRIQDIDFNLFELHETWIKSYSQLYINNKEPWRCWCSKVRLGSTCLYLFLMISSFFTSRMPLETRTFAILSTRRVLSLRGMGCQDCSQMMEGIVCNLDCVSTLPFQALTSNWSWYSFHAIELKGYILVKAEHNICCCKSSTRTLYEQQEGVNTIILLSFISTGSEVLLCPLAFSFLLP